MKIGRNDTCPCGSGKKYKRCCLVNDQAAGIVDHEWQRFRAAEAEVVVQLMQVAYDWYGPDFPAKAWQEYTKDSPDPLPMEQTPEAEYSFVPWSLFNYVPQEFSTDESPELVPMAFSVLAMAHDDLNPDERLFILEALREPVSFWSVQEVEPGKTLKLRDLFRYEERVVRERQASEVLTKGDIVYTRVMSLGQTNLMFGMAPVPFPPRFQLDILDAREILFGPRRKVTIKNLQDCESLLRQLYFNLRRRVLNPQPLVLQNTDGDPLEFLTLTYHLNCSQETAFKKLRSLNVTETEEALLADATKDDDGELQTVTFSWTKKGNEKHRSWDNTILGNIKLKGSTLSVEVNSQARAELVQAEIAKRLGGDALLQNSVSKSIAEALAERQNGEQSEEVEQQRAEQAALETLPEVQALMKEMAQAHWDEWLNEPVPALRGKTPKQAAKTVAGRERLEALLVDFEQTAKDITTDPFAPAVTELRRQLGMLPAGQPQTAVGKRKRPANGRAEREPVPLYQLKITLKESEPLIWRRVVVRSDMVLHRLHGVIQRVMGWTDSHLHQFIVGKIYYGTPDPGLAGFLKQRNEKRYTIADIAPAVKSRFVYEYDFGDSWEHQIVVEKILPPDPEFLRPVCLAGANACPPEDCGGIPGYYNLLEILANPRNPEHESMKEWLGYDFDPARFNLDLANGVLRGMKA